MASSSCTGKVDDRICDSSRLITSEAAICIALAGGISEGLDLPRAGLVYNYQYRRIIWSVTNVIFRAAPDAGRGGRREEGDAWAVDAVSGEILDKDSYVTIACASPNHGLRQPSARLVATRGAKMALVFLGLNGLWAAAGSGALP
jgi:hypothetical protein